MVEDKIEVEVIVFDEDEELSKGERIEEELDGCSEEDDPREWIICATSSSDIGIKRIQNPKR